MRMPTPPVSSAPPQTASYPGYAQTATTPAQMQPPRHQQQPPPPQQQNQMPGTQGYNQPQVRSFQIQHQSMVCVA